MPDLILLMTQDASQRMSDSVFVKITDALTLAVVETLGFDDSKSVVSYEIVARRTRNANAIQVLCVASKSEERLKNIIDLRRALSEALLSLEGDAECLEYFHMVGKVETWPIMPDGNWGEVIVGSEGL